MKAQIIAVFAAAFLAAVAIDGQLGYEQGFSNRISDMSQFENFILSFGRSYATPAEKDYRFKIFSLSLDEIRAVNSANLSYRFGVNDFADLSQEEIRAKFHGYRANFEKSPKPLNMPVSLTDAPAEVDWRAKGAVTPVEYQRICGSCWAFASAACLEGAYFIKNSKLIEFSKQQLVDCSWKQGNQGCFGGEMRFAFTYWEKKGFLKESDYAYTAKDGLCKFDKKADLVVGIGRGFVQNGDTEDDLQASVIGRPTAAAINTFPIMKYESGIYDNVKDCPANPRDLNHAVLVVGYGADPQGNKYWIVKNSYGVKWGENGYVRLGRGLVSGGTCGLALDTNYVLI